MFLRSYRPTVAFIVFALALSSAVATPALAQRQNGSGNNEAALSEESFPQAARQTPSLRASVRMQGRLQRLFSAYEKEDAGQVLTLAQEIIDAERANAYDKAVAHQLAAQVAWRNNDSPAAQQHLQQVIEFNALDNTRHFQAMRMLAQLQLQDEHYEHGLATLERYLAESGSDSAEDWVIKGQALYQMQRYEDAIDVLQTAMVKAHELPLAQWQPLLLAAYVEAQRMDEAVALAEQLAANQADNKPAQINLATVYLQADQLTRAAEVLERLRSAGQLEQEREYRQLYSIYAQMEGKEHQVIEVINEGLEKGILQADYPIYLALAQSYYYSGQIPQAISAWQHAAPLSDDGETWLNLARVLHAENRISEAKQAAQQALAKGVRDPKDANGIINLK